MRKNVNLLSGPIFPALTKLAIPIMGTQLLQMAYNLIDMIWIGRVGSNAVAAVGAAGMYMWLAAGVAILARMGGQVKVAHAIGAQEMDEAVTYAKASIQLGLILGVIYGALMLIFNNALIGFFNFNGDEVIRDARLYLMIGCGMIVFSFLNMVLAGLVNAIGNSQTSFLASTIGLVVNMILDPILIFGLGPFPKLNTAGAAIATVFAQIVVTIAYLIIIRKDTVLFDKIHVFTKTPVSYFKTILKISYPISIQNMFLTFISMIVARIVAGWGDAAVAVQKVGSQIESISWMTAEGFSVAMNAFIGQNFGAKNVSRLKKGYGIGLIIALVWGAFTTFLLLAFPQFIFKIFIVEDALLPMGVDYLRILAFSQILMCIEIMTTGAFSGLGKTMPPAIEGLVFNIIRIPLALILSKTSLGLNGIWLSITITSIFKGIVLAVWYRISFKKTEKKLYTA